MLERHLHIEPSSRCSLSCPQCPRTQYLDLIAIEDCDIDATVRACTGFDVALMCGNHGDPIYHPRFHSLVSEIKSAHPNIHIRIITNGAFRTPAWWERLGGLLTGPGDIVTYSIDGLPSNNHMYRVNSKWQTIEDGINALRSVNPTVTMIWKWIYFKYNQHDIKQGIELAKQLKFNKFMLVSSVRYETGHYLTPDIPLETAQQEVLSWYK